MTKNITRFKTDFKRFVQEGELLHLAMQNEVHGEEFAAMLRKQFGKEEANKMLEALPKFGTAYERWYSESLAVLRQLIPDRVGKFVSQ